MTGASNLLIIIVGPTAVGKTDLSIQLAQKISGEIISADSRLFYRGMDIGTAKPSLLERKGIPHHMIDIAEPDEIISMAEFQKITKSIIKDIRDRGNLPILVGGTGQYVRAVTQGWAPPQVIPHPKLREVLEGLGKEFSPKWLHDKLIIVDPIAAENIDFRNLRRTVRALEVILTTGKKFSDQRALEDSPYNVAMIGLNRPRPELYERVDARIEKMFTDGFLNEVQILLNKGYSPSLPSMSAIGYRECIRVINGELTEEQAKVEIRRATRVFVRRQANWFKESDPQIHWFHPDQTNLIEKISEMIVHLK
jgi:tRNA dimethylallyltransferase